MRILHLISSTGFFGAERVVTVLCKTLKLYNNDVIVGVIRNEYNPHVEVAEEAKRYGLDTVIFPCAWQFDLRTVFLLRRFITCHDIQLIHSHGYKSNLFALLASIRRIPSVSTNHNWLTRSLRLKVYCFFDSLWLRSFDRIVAVSEQIKEEMISRGVPSHKISIIHNGIDLDRFDRNGNIEQLKKKFSIPPHDIIIGSIGKLNPEKGHICLLRAAKEILAEHKNMRFIIIGDGALREYLTLKAVEYGIADNIIFTGFQKDIPSLLAMIDIFVLPSLTEGLPMVLLEAMAAGKRIIATRVGAVPQVLQTDCDAILITPNDHTAIVAAVTQIMGNPTKAMKMAENAFKKVRAEFTHQILCENYIKLYEDIIPY